MCYMLWFGYTEGGIGRDLSDTWKCLNYAAMVTLILFGEFIVVFFATVIWYQIMNPTKTRRAMNRYV